MKPQTYGELDYTWKLKMARLGGPKDQKRIPAASVPTALAAIRQDEATRQAARAREGRDAPKGRTAGETTRGRDLKPPPKATP